MIKKIIFDYGGVISYGSRTDALAGILKLDQIQREALEKRLKHPDIKKAAVGAYNKEFVSTEIAKVLTDITYNDICYAIYLASQPESKMIDLVIKIKEDYEIYLVSNSIPEYSEYILDHCNHLFDGIYLSDKYHARKPTDLFEKIISIDESFFSNSIYIDDVRANLHLPQTYGAIPIEFISYSNLIENLTELSIIE
ncbi:hypothetical protein NJD71_01460 [Psychrobacter sp. PP-21]|uniref:hypothetical protein n=1 Tax=Psychrobacter sp. PP-21 TaxID=2957503 RepID=UPI0029AEE3DD|nr:hypothetical protein [Psychrobacter sp. PP-21]MDX2372790.1 hypothetical protein [Psychrobacter sp. PP-21]